MVKGVSVFIIVIIDAIHWRGYSCNEIRHTAKSIFKNKSMMTLGEEDEPEG